MPNRTSNSTNLQPKSTTWPNTTLRLGGGNDVGYNMSSKFEKQFQSKTFAVDLAVTVVVSVCNLQTLAAADSDHSQRPRAKNISQST